VTVLINRYPRHRNPDPATPAPTVTPAADQGTNRNALVERLTRYPGDWRRLAYLLLDTRGPETFTDAALLTMTRILDAIESKPTTENESC